MRPDLEAIRARCEAASGPSWTWEADDSTTFKRTAVSRIVSMDAIRDRQASGIKTSARLMYLATVYSDADTAFIAHARTDIPALLAYVEELEADRATLLHREVMLKRAHGALTDAGCVVPLEFDRTIEHAIKQLAQERDEERMRTRCFEQAMAEAETDLQELRARIAELEARCKGHQAMRHEILRAIDTWKQPEVNDDQ